MKNETNNIHSLIFEEKEIILVGTAHVSKESVQLVSDIIETEKPDTVCVELCDARYQSIRQKDKWLDTDIIKVIKEKKSFLLLSNLLLASFQKRIADKFDIVPGAEMIKAIDAGEAVGADIHLADRNIRITLAKTWRAMGLWGKIKLLFQLLLSMGEIGDISEEDIEKMKQEDVLESLLADVGKSLPVLKDILIDERDQFLTYKIRTAPGKKIVAVVGAGHVPGIKKYWEAKIDVERLNQIPPKGKLSGILKWIIPLGILVLFVLGFYYGGTHAGTNMITWWVMANGILAGLGAVIALAHPFTILSSILAAPLTSLNPMIAAGWVSGLIEAFLRKPKVRDFENLPNDILSIRGFWKNKITRILLVVVFTNLGSSIGTFVAIPLMVKVL
ncbi:MAG: TraB/GumN family protein [Desulfobacteraceae bacterium]|nr:TraB/GumN family protein [Desulfobacteraceae bacterium]MDH3573160.1 TraB/GumN family protein [Desulfobacteraceae bacterium]MDH3720375.1 TraB/GumN family protein [Desulfobacteraceae bacterium]MDH3837431.1 TraB/GumN family protein [Desulfobacteraceae bacterium]MDH3873275.1 TraB/GumN family protein [Desulfobacteraceae bacterium]